MAWLLRPSSLLQQVQQAAIFSHDSKHFVDMPVRTSVHAMQEHWQQLDLRGVPVTPEELRDFVAQHFGEPGSDMEAVPLVGWDDRGPAFLRAVAPPAVGKFGTQVHALWQTLHRKVSDDVLAHPERHTLLPLPHPFVIPGDRFREVYYWDSYWIMLGLVACELQGTALGMVRNLLSLVDACGFVPNGSRTYYMNRSQPPLLSSMVSLCHRAAPDAGLLREALPRLLKTWDFWTSGNKALLIVGGAASAAEGMEAGNGGRQGGGSRVYRLSRYYADWDGPRPESYREDTQLAAGLSPDAACRLYRELASAAESGWDFSSRFFADGASLATIRTTQVVPVDLNAYLLLTARHISEFAAELGDAATAAAFADHAECLQAALAELMWDEEAGCWHDLLLTGQQQQQRHHGKGDGCNDQATGQPGASGTAASAGGEEASRPATGVHGPASSSEASCGGGRDGAVWRVERLRRVYASNWVPLWCGACEPGSDAARAAVAGLQASGLIGKAGLMTSLYPTGQQWDAPNAWAPLQHMAIQGLRDCGVPEGVALASELAAVWIQTNMQAYQATGQMHEKYNGQTGEVGTGGEYVPQVGFGWTNGVLLELLRMYPDQRGAAVGALGHMGQAHEKGATDVP